MPPSSLYVHIPFCRHRCGYCDFNTYANQQSLIEPYVAALCEEIAFAGSFYAGIHQVHTIYFGGGTPSLLTASQLALILETIHRVFRVIYPVEISLEANPGTLTRTYLRELMAFGINRLSLGVQSVHPGELRLLERQHDYFDVLNAVKWARQAGIKNLNLDLIFGLPEQVLASWQRSLSLATDLAPEHLSIYSLTIEPDTPFGHWMEHGLLSPANPDQAADMYEWSMDWLAEKGWQQYEISNWARKDEKGSLFSCQHNLQYWRNFPYLGFGAGAHGYIEHVRTENVLSPAAYIKRFKDHLPTSGTVFPKTPATLSTTLVDRDAEIAETMMMGLRLVKEGVSEQTFTRRFGESLDALFQAPIARLTAHGLVEWLHLETDRCLRLTPRGRLLGNQVFVEFI